MELFLLVLFAFTPDRPDLPKSKAKENPVPFIGGHTNWGFLEHDQKDPRKFTITGHSHWEAVGEIRPDGKVFILWTMLSDGRRAPGVYRIEGRDLHGQWAFGENVEVQEDGSLKGFLHDDVTYKLPVEVK